MPLHPEENPLERLASYIRRWSYKYNGAPIGPTKSDDATVALIDLADAVQDLGRELPLTLEAQTTLMIVLDRLEALHFHLPAEIMTRAKRAMRPPPQHTTA